MGDSEGTVQLWDVANTKLVRTMTGHTDRITSLDWNAHILVSGGRSGAIHMHDVRVAQHHVGTLIGHTQVGIFFCQNDVLLKVYLKWVVSLEIF